MSTLTPEDTGIPTPADTGTAAPDPSAPVPIGLQALHDLGVKVEILGKAMQDPRADVKHLCALSAECGLAMHIEIVGNEEAYPDPSVPAHTPEQPAEH